MSIKCVFDPVTFICPRCGLHQSKASQIVGNKCKPGRKQQGASGKPAAHKLKRVKWRKFLD